MTGQSGIGEVNIDIGWLRHFLCHWRARWVVALRTRHFGKACRKLRLLFFPGCAWPYPLNHFIKVDRQTIRAYISGVLRRVVRSIAVQQIFGGTDSVLPSAARACMDAGVLR